jgi:hypothetical protein
MEPFEAFRAYMVKHLALQLGIPVEGRTEWELWVAIHEECPEAARIASDQWLDRDLLIEHLRYGDYVRNLKDTSTTEIEPSHVTPELARYVFKWQQFNLQVEAAIAKRQKVEVESFLFS